EGNVYAKVTSNDDLTIGEQYLIVYENGESSIAAGALATNGNSYGEATVAVADSKITLDDASTASIFTLGGEAGAYTLKREGGNYLELKASSNTMSEAAEVNDNTKFTIDVTAATPIKSNTFSRYFKYNSGSHMFRFYASGQKDIVLYKKQAASAAPAGFRDIKVTLADADKWQALVASGATVNITVAEDGTIGTTDNAAEAAATLTGKWHGTSYGWSNFTASVPVEGTVKITYATHDYGNDITVTNDNGDEVAKFNTNGAKWSSDPANVVVAYYRTNEPTTLHFSNAQYNPYFAVEAIDPADIPAEVTKYTVTFDAGEGTGVVPAAQEVEEGQSITLAENRSLYAEGKTLTGWTDGTTTYAIGETVSPTANITLTAVYTDNTVTLADRTDEVTINWNLEPAKGVADINFESTGVQTGFRVAQADINGTKIDVKMDVDATNGKLSNVSRTSWTQASNVKLTVPSAKNAVISMKGYKAFSTTTINGQNDYDPSLTTIDYTVTAEDETAEIAVTTDVEYLSFVKVTLPAPAAPAISFDEDVTAVWSFKDNLPEGICDATNFQGNSGTLQSTVEGIVMKVDATSGKLYSIGRNNAQMNPGTILKVPVFSTKDVVTVEGYPGYNHYAIDGVEATTDNTEHRATVADVERGYVEVTATAGNNYIYKVQVLIVSMIQNKCLYSTKFNEWDAVEKNTEGVNVLKKTKYSNEDLTFTLGNLGINTGSIDLTGKFDDRPVGWAFFDKNAGASIVTSPLKSITSVRFVQGATGSNRGVKLEAKGDGDADWVVISEAVANPAKWSEITADVNRTNVQLRFTNLAESQYAYLFELDINGKVDMSLSPMLGSFEVNGTKYEAADIFEEQEDGTMAATIELSKQESMITSYHPLTNVIADNGEIESISYTTTGSGASQQTVATIKVKKNDDVLTYITTFVFKPDFRVTFINTSGAPLGIQLVEKDAAIGTFNIDESRVTVPSGKAFRGWFVSAEGGRKYTTEEVITEHTNFYAVATDIEKIDPSARYDYKLNDKYFYPEDHEAFEPVGSGYFHDTQHGWAFANGDEIKLLMSAKGYVKLGLCQYSGSADIELYDPSGNKVGAVNAKVSTDGQAAIINYEGEAGTLTLKFNGTAYLHDLSIVNMEETPYTQEGNWYIVKPGDAKSLITTLEIVGAADASQRAFIFLPDGTYDLGESVLTQISRNNISLVGQSTDNTIIKNAPDTSIEGIGTTATILNTSQNLYMQDLTLQNALDYYATGSAGRAVCLQDKGNRTIAKNVKMLSYQDTYYSNADSQFYWETSEIHGTVDYLCGSGDVFYNGCTFVNESRAASGKSGSDVIAAPYPGSSIQYGYVMDGCTIENNAASFSLGRSWGGQSKLTWLNTTIKQPSEVISSRFTLAGMNIAAYKFKEYNSTDEEGNVVTPESLVETFTHSTGDYTYDIVLSAEEAANYTLEKVFSNWKPAESAAQIEAPEATYADGTITWEAVDGAIAYAIFKNGEFVAITTETSYVIDGVDAENDALEIRSANAMGGLGEGARVAGTTGIRAINGETQEVIYNLQGIRLQKAGKGLYIINGKKVVK
ncbi:MAG: InlB B-repeat-containing protein, partial [Prevotella sp.]|nr:InlB B-repeat-containing protein [Prevotella sp.]